MWSSIVYPLLLVATTAVAATSSSSSISTSTNVFLRSLKEEEEDSASTCYASLENFQYDIGVETIEAQKLYDSWSHVMEGDNMRMTNNGNFPPLSCAANEAQTCEKRPRMCVVNDVDGTVLFMETFTPTCRPNACAKDEDYEKALISHGTIHGASAYYWYPLSGNSYVDACIANPSHCHFLYTVCGVRIEYPFDPTKFMTQAERLAVLDEPFVATQEDQVDAIEDAIEKDNNGADNNGDGNQSNSSASSAAISGLAMILFIAGGIVAFIFIAFLVSKKTRADKNSTSFFHQYE